MGLTAPSTKTTQSNQKTLSYTPTRLHKYQLSMTHPPTFMRIKNATVRTHDDMSQGDAELIVALKANDRIGQYLMQEALINNKLKSCNCMDGR